MKVTFDSNLYRRVTEPARFGRDPAYAAYSAIHEAIRAGTIQPFFSATIVTLEAVGREQRGAYMSSQRIKADTNASPAGEHRIRGRLTIGADDSVHPGLPPILERWLEEALALGFRFLAAPRLGQPRPRILHDAPNFAPVEELDLNKFGEIVGEMEARGLGSAPARAIAASIRLRNPRIPMHPWSRALAFAADIHERRAIARAVAEWSDGDAVAAHIAYHRDLFCTEDLGKSAGALSVLAPLGRSWLGEACGVVFSTAEELAARLRTL